MSTDPEAGQIAEWLTADFDLGPGRARALVLILSPRRRASVRTDDRIDGVVSGPTAHCRNFATSQLRNFATSQLRNFADSPSMRCVNPAGISPSPSPPATSAWSLTDASSRFFNPPQTDRKRDHAQKPVTDSPFRGRRVRELDGQSPRSRLRQHCPRRRAARTVATGMLTAPDPRRRERASLAALA